MNLKPFDLEKALAGEPVVTRSGIKVIEVSCFKADIPFPLRFLLEDETNYTARRDGRTYGDYEDSPLDLFMAPTTKTMWYCVYKDPNGNLITSTLYDTEQEMVEDLGQYTILATHSIETEQ